MALSTRMLRPLAPTYVKRLQLQERPGRPNTAESGCYRLQQSRSVWVSVQVGMWMQMRGQAVA